LLDTGVHYYSFFNRTGVHTTIREQSMQGSPTPIPATPRLLDQLRWTAQQRGHGEPTVAALLDWCRRFILFQTSMAWSLPMQATNRTKRPQQGCPRDA
jgi:hypothetical protein